jgi:hypothetical protein
VVRLIRKWLKAGVMEGGEWSETKEGSPQGSVISPILANLYLHYVLDLWVEAWRKKQVRGEVIIVRYADDAVLGFEHREEAERFLEQLRERLRKFGLELHPEKTRLIEFGRYAAERREKRGEGRPETFNFLGFTHICGTSHKTGYFTVHRRTIGKRMAAKLKEIRAKLRKRMHVSPGTTGKWLAQAVRGYFQYHAIPGNWARLKAFRNDVRRIWFQTLRRRSQRSRLSWQRFREGLGSLLPPIQILQPYQFGVGTIKGVARKLGIHRRMVREALADAVPKERKRVERARPRLEPAIPFIDAILEKDVQAPRKQWHTAHRIYDRLRAEKPEIAESLPWGPAIPHP